METRIQRYKNYRAEMVKDGSEDTKLTEKPLASTTTALPLHEVMSNAEADEINAKFYARQRKLKIIQYAFIVGLVLLIVAGLIVAGYFVFRG